MSRKYLEDQSDFNRPVCVGISSACLPHSQDYTPHYREPPPHEKSYDLFFLDRKGEVRESFLHLLFLKLPAQNTQDTKVPCTVEACSELCTVVGVSPTAE